MKANINNTTALILAGGQGQRMNYADKGLINWHNKPLIAHVIAAIEKQVNHIVISANQHHEDYQTFRLDLVKDDIAGFQGPLSGILSGMRYCRESEYLLILPCDCPTPPADLFQKLANAINADPQADIAIVDDGSRLQPLFGLYKTQLAEKLQSALDNSENKVMKFIHDNNVVSVDYSSQANAFKNFNNPEDLQ